MKLLFTLGLLLVLPHAFSQENKTPVLEREISISANSQSLETVLENISSQADFVFSYNPEAIDSKKTISINIRKRSVRYVLNQLLSNDNVEYKVKGKYVILKGKGTSKPETQLFEGYVFDSQTGKKLTEASVYDKSLLASAITDKYGYFSMEVPADKPIKLLQVSKLGYSDTLLVSLDSTTRNRNIEVTLQKQDSLPKKSRIDFGKINPGWLVPNKLKVNARNISNPVFRSVQLSLIPYLSTNKLLGGAAINDVSVNATVGYVQGIRKFEAGGLINFVRNDVKYFQAAGLANIVGGNVTGFQAAGILNTGKKVKGFQAAGIFNQTTSVFGSQVAGLLNLNHDTATIQIAGIFNSSTLNVVQVTGLVNHSHESTVQVAGLINLSKSSKVQLAGLGNISDSLPPSQIVGLFNLSKSNSVFQLAGGLNLTKENAEVQIAGLLNKAKHVRKFQLALINIADSASGTSIGLFSLIRKGYHKLEISADESFPVNVAFRTGTYKFHTFVTSGISSFNIDKGLWNVGYGIGTSIGNPAKTLVDLDFSTQEIFYGSHLNGSFHLYKLYFGIDRRLIEKMSLFAGVSYNVLLSDSFASGYNQLNDRMPFYTLSETNFNNGHNLKTWIGGKIGVRFF